jgi:hypothetical protein
MDRLDDAIVRSREVRHPRPQFLEIDLGRARRWWGLMGYLLFYVTVAIILVALLLQFTRSAGLAVGLVVVMVGYMSLMGRWAMNAIDHNHHQRRR